MAARAAQAVPVTGPARRIVDPRGLLRPTWIVLALPALALLGAIYGRFRLHLRPQYRTAFLACGGAFVAGAVGLEALGGLFVQDTDGLNLRYALIATGEELLEMLAMAGFAVALTAYLPDLAATVRFDFPR